MQLEQPINTKIAGKHAVNVTEAGNREEKDEDVSKNLLEALKASVRQKNKPKR